MGWDITGAARIAILKPSTADIIVLLIDDKIDVLELLLVFVCGSYSGDAGADADHAHLSFPVKGLLE